MTEIKVWVGDLAEYNNGKLVGEWFTLPMDLDEMVSEVLVEGNEEFYIGDTDSEINLSNYSLNELNELAEKLEGLDEYEQKALMEILDNYTSDLEEAVEIVENGDFMFYHDCHNMSDVAFQWYDETGQLAELTKYISEHYIDFDAIGRDMEIEGNFIRVDYNTYIEIIR